MAKLPAQITPVRKSNAVSYVHLAPFVALESLRVSRAIHRPCLYGAACNSAVSYLKKVKGHHRWRNSQEVCRTMFATTICLGFYHALKRPEIKEAAACSDGFRVSLLWRGASRRVICLAISLP